MKNLCLSLLFSVVFVFNLCAQTKYEYMQFTTVEVFGSAAKGASRIVAPLFQVTPPLGGRPTLNSTDLKDIASSSQKILQNYDMLSNDTEISLNLTKASEKGWELYAVSTGVLESTILYSRYILRRPLK